MTNKSTLWNLWLRNQTLYQKPSEALSVQQWASDLLGMTDTCTALAFDNAVMTFGIWCENRLQERWSDGTPKYTLDDLLHGDEEQYIRARNQRTADALFAQVGVRAILVA